MGHLEAAAAAAGLSSLVAGPLLAGVVAVNAQLRRLVCDASQMKQVCLTRRLNAHLASIASSGSFRMPAEVLPRGIDATVASRLSSFGFSGTIAHGAFAFEDATRAMRYSRLFTSLFRRNSTARDTWQRFLLSQQANLNPIT